MDSGLGCSSFWDCWDSHKSNVLKRPLKPHPPQLPLPILAKASPQPAIALASDAPSAVKVSTPLLASNETFIKVAKDAMASVVNISATKRSAQTQKNPFYR